MDEHFIIFVGMALIAILIIGVALWVMNSQRMSARERYELLEIHEVAKRLGVQDRFAQVLKSPGGSEALAAVVRCEQCQDVLRCHEHLGDDADSNKMKPYCPNVEFLQSLKD